MIDAELHAELSELIESVDQIIQLLKSSEVKNRQEYFSKMHEIHEEINKILTEMELES